MAKNKVYIDVVVDDKGTTKRVAVNAKKLGLALEETSKSARTADRNLKGASQQSANGTKNFSKMAQGISGTLVPAYAVLASNIFALTAAFSFLERAADFRVLQDAQVAFSSATGKGYITLSRSIQAAADGLIGYQKASQIAAIGSASGLSGKQLQDLTRGATDAALVLGRNVPDAIDRVIRGVTKAEPELLDELGVILRLKDATEAYAQATGQSVNDLSAFERSQAVAADVLGQLEKKYSSVTKEIELQANKITKLKTAFEKVFIPVQKTVAAASETLAGFLTNNIPSLTAALTLVAVPILRAIIPATEAWTENTREATKAIKTDIGNAGKAIDDLSDRQKALKDSSKSLVTAVAGQLEGKETKSKGVAAIREGKTPTKTQLRALIREAEKGRGVVKGMSEGMKRDYINNLKLMLSETTSFATSTKAQIQGIGLQFKKVGLEIVRGWKFAMLQVQRATQVMASTVDKAVKVISIVGFLLLIKDALVAIGEAFGFIGQSKAIKDLADELRSAEGSLEDLAKEFSKFDQIQQKYREKNDNKMGLDYYQAEASFIQASGEALSKSLQAREKFNKLSAEQISLADQIANKQREYDKLEKEYTENKLKRDENGKIKTSRALKQEEQALGRLKKDLNDLKDQAAGALDPNILEKWVLGYESVEEASESLKNKIKEQAGTAIQILEKQGIQSTTAGKKYIELLNIIKEGRELTAQQTKDFEELNEVYGTTAQRLASIQEGALKFDQTFRNIITSITQFQTSYSTTLLELDREILSIQEMLGQTNISEDQSNALMAQLNKYISMQDTIRKLEELEVNQKLRKQGIQKEVIALTQGATTLEKEQIDRAQKRAEIENQRLFIMEQVRAAQEAQEPMAEAQAKNLQNQLDILEEQERALERQEVIIFRIVDGMEQALESSFQSGVAALIKGAKDFKDVLKDIANSVLGSVADNIAKALTEKIFTDKDTPEDRIQRAMLDAADYHGAVIKAALTGTTQMSSSGIDSMINDIARMKGGGGNISSASIDSMINDIAGNKTSSSGGANDEAGLFEKLFGKSKTTTSRDDTFGAEGVTVKQKVGGSVTNFLGSLSDIFDKNADGGLVEKLGNVFEAGGSIFKDIFSSLLGSLSNVLGGMGGGIGGLLGFFFANGGIAKGGFRSAAYANGGIARQPTLGLVGEGKYDEAIVPLPDGKSIPVTMPGGAGQNNNVTVNVTMHQDGRVEQQTEGDRGTHLGHMIASAVQKELQNQKRSGGILNPYGTA